MTIEDFKETAALAHFNPDESELAGLFPAFAEMIGFFDTMQAADASTAEGLGNSRTVNSGFYRVNAPSNENTSPGLTESMLNNAGERDGRFLVVPNVL